MGSLWGSNGKNRYLVAFAKRTLPMLERHLYIDRREVAAVNRPVAVLSNDVGALIGAWMKRRRHAASRITDQHRQSQSHLQSMQDLDRSSQPASDEAGAFHTNSRIAATKHRIFEITLSAQSTGTVG